jgi:DNA-binding winged helix-turn-helix (wHTH) protein
MIQDHLEAQYPSDTRFAEIEKILKYTAEGNSCQIIGVPGIGRTSLLEILAYNKELQKKHLGTNTAQTHFVIVNFSEIRNRSLFDAMKLMFLNFTESLREEKMTEEHKVVGDTFREHLQFQDELILFQGFKEAVDYMANERKITMVFLFDRFEEYIPVVTSAFFTNLRGLRSNAKYHFSIVFSVPRPLEALLEPSLLADYYEFVADRHIYLRVYDAPSTHFRLSYIEKITKKKVDKKLFEKVVDFTGGLGKLTKLAVESLLAENNPPEDLQAFLLAQKTIKAALRDIWETLSPAEQADILEGVFGDREVAAYLEHVGLIKDKQIQMPLFAAYIKTSAKEETVGAQKIVYDENTNTIQKGSDALSDQLTSSEFRLLKYLLQNQEKVIERDALISVVWQGNKSTAGITDQAVDQLVFRVRRKIEEDPNNPQHLQTVKGRGFKFVS